MTILGRRERHPSTTLKAGFCGCPTWAVQMGLAYTLANVHERGRWRMHRNAGEGARATRLAWAGPNKLYIFLLEDVYRIALLGFVEGDDLFEIVVVEDEDAARWPAHRSIVFRKTFGRGILLVRIAPKRPNCSVI